MTKRIEHTKKELTTQKDFIVWEFPIQHFRISIRNRIKTISNPLDLRDETFFQREVSFVYK